MFETDIDILCRPQCSVTTNANSSIDEEIKIQTSLVRDYQEKLLLALNARASLLVHAERLDLALNDAIAMTILDPSSALGYLSAGSIHSLRQQYASAIKFYDDGLARSSRSHPHYERLLNARSAAYDSSNTRIDFISKLPLDIVIHNIIPRILQGRTLWEVGKPCHYFDVCRTWRQRMALANGLHYVIGNEELSDDGYKRIGDLAPLMRTLTVVQPKSDILYKVTREHHIRLNMLTKLSIVESTGREHSALLASLRTLSNTLTDLEIEYGGYEAPTKSYRLCDVLEACPNLVSIRMKHGDVDMSSVNKTYPKIVKLDLWNKVMVANKDNISTLLRPFPQLRLLRMCPIPRSDFLPMIDQHCPLLQQLILTFQSPPFFDILDTEERTGLRGLSVPTIYYGESFTEDDTVRYVMKHSETLEAFGVMGRYGFRSPNNLLEDVDCQQVTFKQLRQIHFLKDADESLTPFVLWMIQHAPHLESVETVFGPQQASIMQELTRPQHANLKRLRMQANYYPSGYEGEERLIKHHLELGQQSNLTELKIHISHRVLKETWLILIPRLTQLTTLEFSTLLDHHTLESLQQSLMKDLADGCPSLEQLTMISGRYPMDFGVLYPMDRHTNLKSIVINCPEIHGDVSSFSQRFTKIESLHLSVCKYSLADIDSLEKGSFNLVFTDKLPETPISFRTSLT